MGLANEHADVNPSNFTKKRSGEPKLKDGKQFNDSQKGSYERHASMYAS